MKDSHRSGAASPSRGWSKTPLFHSVTQRPGSLMPVSFIPRSVIPVTAGGQPFFFSRKKSTTIWLALRDQIMNDGLARRGTKTTREQSESRLMLQSASAPRENKRTSKHRCGCKVTCPLLLQLGRRFHFLHLQEPYPIEVPSFFNQSDLSLSRRPVPLMPGTVSIERKIHTVLRGGGSLCFSKRCQGGMRTSRYSMIREGGSLICLSRKRHDTSTTRPGWDISLTT